MKFFKILLDFFKIIFGIKKISKPTPTPQETSKPTSTPTGTLEPTPTSSEVIEPTSTPTSTLEPTPTSTEFIDPTTTPTETMEPTPTSTDIIEPTPTPTETVEPTPTSTEILELTPTHTETETPLVTPTITETQDPLSPKDKFKYVLEKCDGTELLDVYSETEYNLNQIIHVNQEGKPSIKGCFKIIDFTEELNIELTKEVIIYDNCETCYSENEGFSNDTGNVSVSVT